MKTKTTSAPPAPTYTLGQRLYCKSCEREFKFDNLIHCPHCGADADQFKVPWVPSIGCLVRAKAEHLGTVIGLKYETSHGGALSLVTVLHEGGDPNGCDYDPQYVYPSPRWSETDPSMVVAVTSCGHWGKGYDLEHAIAECYGAGAHGSQHVVIYHYSGPKDLLDEIWVDNTGGIRYPQQVTANRVGRVKMSMKQEVTK